MNDLQKLHSAANDHFLERLHSGLLAMRGGAGYFSPPLQEFAGGALVPTDPPGLADAGRDINGCEGPIA